MKLPFTKITVDSALAGLSKALTDLDTASAYHRAEHDRVGEEASRLITVSNQHLRDAMRAERAQAKLAELLA
jgi:hypothetical protein